MGGSYTMNLPTWIEDGLTGCLTGWFLNIMLCVGSFSEYANDLKSNDFIGLSRTDCITESRHCSMAGRALKNCASASMKAVRNSKSSSFLIVFSVFACKVTIKWGEYKKKKLFFLFYSRTKVTCTKWKLRKFWVSENRINYFILLSVKNLCNKWGEYKKKIKKIKIICINQKVYVILQLNFKFT